MDLTSDVCVVGAGPAGLSLADALVRAGVRVLLLESGPERPAPGGCDVPSTRSVGLPYDPATTRSSGVGGSALRWYVPTPGGQDHVRLKELDPVDFEARGPGSVGWPFGPDELARHYASARELFGLRPGGSARDAPVRDGLERRVYSFARASVITEDLPARLRAHPLVTLLAGARVTEVLTADAPDVVSGLRCRLPDGQERVVTARSYVLAGGAIENARLLLASRGTHAAGLGNSHDQVGRYFMEHPHYSSGVVVPGPVDDLRGRPALWDVVESGPWPEQDKYVLSPSVLRREGLLNAAYKVKAYDYRGALGFGHDGSVDDGLVAAFYAARSALRRRRPSDLGADGLATLAAGSGELLRYTALRASAALRARTAAGGPQHHGYRVLVMAEQEPHRDSRLRLVGERDHLGVPMAELDWRLTATDLRSMLRGQQLVAPALAEVVGARVVTLLGPDGVPQPGGGAHHMGTTRMSVRPTDGVVDARSRVHGIANLRVAGSSVFPRGGAANPTLTIVALALRMAEDLVGELGRPVELAEDRV